MTIAYTVKGTKTKSGQRKRLELKNDEIELLLYLEKSRCLSSNQLYAVYTSVQKIKLSQRGFWYRLAKYEEYKLIQSKIYDIGPNGSFKYYRVNTKGIVMLIELGYLPEDYSMDNSKKVFSKSNIEHYLGTQEVVVNTLGLIHSDGNMDTYARSAHSLNPSYAPITNVTDNSVFIRPDWTVKVKNHYYCIEFDTSSMGLPALVDKILRYRDLPSHYPKNEYYVVFSIIDSSFKTKKQKDVDKIKRVSNLKQAILEMPVASNLGIPVYVSLMKRSPHVIQRQIGELPSAYQMVNSLLSKWESFKGNNISITHLNKEFLEQYELLTGQRPDYLIEEVLPTKKKIRSVFLFLREGNVVDWTKVIPYAFTETLNKSGAWVDRVYCLYESKEEMESDIRPMTLDEHVYFGNIEEWRGQKKPIVYKPVTHSRLKEVEL